MEKGDEKHISPVRYWIATVVVVLVVIAAWKFIDCRMEPPPPPNPVMTPAPVP
jgi:hypothetical protein